MGYIRPRGADETDVPGVELIPNEDRYFLGGANSVRGFSQDFLDGTVPGAPEGQAAGGLAEFLLSLENRMPVRGRFSAVVFLDAGNVWQDRTDIRLERWVPHSDPENVSPEDVRYVYGLGLRFDTGLGPIRLDYARKWNIPADSGEERDRWHFALGHSF
jgi:outer membrane protein assembly factor BamA